MTFDEATAAAMAGQKITRPHWCWLYISKDGRGLLSLYDDDGHRKALFRATRGDKRADDWQPYAAAEAATNG